MSTATVEDQGFSVTTRIQASPDAVFKAWTDGPSLARWLAASVEIDARPGGAYVYRWPTPDGELSARGEFKELVPGQRIVQSWEAWGPQGRFDGADAEIVLEFRDLGDGWTEMVQTETGPAYRDPSHTDMAINGTKQAHEALVAFVTQPG